MRENYRTVRTVADYPLWTRIVGFLVFPVIAAVFVPVMILSMLAMAITVLIVLVVAWLAILVKPSMIKIKTEVV